MPRDRQAIGPCAHCGQGTVQCTGNRFLNGDEQIDSWEHRCMSCNHRDTQAQRTTVDPATIPAAVVCPFCGRQSTSLLG